MDLFYRQDGVRIFFLKDMGSSMVDVKANGQTLCWFNAMSNQVVDIGIFRDNGQDQKARLGNYCCLSIWVASIEGNKTQPRNITMTHTQITCPNRIALRAG